MKKVEEIQLNFLKAGIGGNEDISLLPKKERLIRTLAYYQQLRAAFFKVIFSDARLPNREILWLSDSLIKQLISVDKEIDARIQALSELDN